MGHGEKKQPRAVKRSHHVEWVPDSPTRARVRQIHRKTSRSSAFQLSTQHRGLMPTLAKPTLAIFNIRLWTNRLQQKLVFQSFGLLVKKNNKKKVKPQIPEKWSRKKRAKGGSRKMESRKMGGPKLPPSPIFALLLSLWVSSRVVSDVVGGI